MPGRTFSAASAYRYGFNGKEQDSAINGAGVDYDYGARIYDARAGRFLSVDVITKKYPFYSPYQFGGNNPIEFIDKDGNEPWKNPKYPGLAELYGISVISNILNQAEGDYHRNESEWFKNEPVIKGNYSCGPKSTDDGSKYITDVSKNADPRNKYNMFVSNSTKFYVDESNAKDYDNYERAVTLGLLQNFVSSNGAENYVFPKNGIISSKFLKSGVLQEALSKYLLTPSKTYSDQSNFGAWDLAKDVFRNVTFTGSAWITVSSNEKDVDINIFNITSLYSGTLGKEVIKKLSPKSYVRWPEGQTPFGNISQTFQLSIPYNTSGDKNQNIKDVISTGSYKQ